MNNKKYEIELDLSLNDRDFWIANYDQKRLYQLISDMDIKVYYGSDFLLNLTDEGVELIQEFSLLPYGLVLMYEADWEQIKKNLLEDELLHASVPIYINHQLGENGGEESFKLISGLEKSFVFSPDVYQEWLDGLSSKQKEIAKTYNTIDKKIEHIRRIDYSAEILLQKESSVEFADKLSRLKEERDEIASRLDEKEGAIFFCGNRLDLVHHNL